MNAMNLDNWSKLLSRENGQRTTNDNKRQIIQYQTSNNKRQTSDVKPGPNSSNTRPLPKQ